MYIVYVFGIVMWLTYGIDIKDLPIISANTVTLVLTVIILIYKLKYKSGPCSYSYRKFRL